MKTNRFPYKNRKRTFFERVFLSILIVFAILLVIDGGFSAHAIDKAKYVIVMIGDGWSANDIEATKKYCQATLSCPATPPYDLWTKYFMSTYYDGAGCGYDPNQAWSTFNYVKTGCITDSAAAATALYTGSKTQNGRISVSSGGTRLVTIEERARIFGMASGAISTVELSDATPGAWMAHNDNRDNSYAIADEGFFGDPNTTGSPSTPQYAGGHGPTLPPAEVIIGDGRSTYVSTAIKTKLRTESGQAGKHYLVERQSGQDGGNNLIAASNDPNVFKLAGLFDQAFRRADGSGYNAENPTLSESSTAALNVLNRNPNGFILMIEGGAIDWSGHGMNLNYAVGEMIDFNDAVQTVINWIEDPSNGSSWSNTLLIVTGDHETGYLTAGPGVFPDQPLGTVNDATLALEKIDNNTGFRASWNDQDGDNRIDTGEQVNWSWNNSGHTNSLIPFYVKGAGAGLFAAYATNNDPVRGPYIDNTNVFNVTTSVLSDFGAPTSVITAPVHGAILSSASPNPYTISGTATDNVTVQGIEVSTNGGSTWNAAVCSGCPGANVTWTYSWGLPADGSYTLKSRATDTSSNIETPGAGNTITVDRTGPSVSSTVPANGATGVALNSDVTINWNENMDCTTVTTSTVTISPAVGWTRKSCSGSQAVFTTSGQAVTTLYNMTVTTGVKDVAGNQMAGSYSFSYTTGSTQACSGFLSVTPGQTLYGNLIDLTSIVTANDAVNLNYTVSESCPAQSNEAIITKGGFWKYDLENTGTTWMNTGYDDSGWSFGGGIFGTEPDDYGYSITTPIAKTNLSMFFRKTFYVCDPSQITALRLNSLFDDGMTVYINGTLVYSQGVSGNPPLWNGGAVGHEATTYEAKDLTSVIGLNALRNLLVPGSNNVIAVGVYNVSSVSSDLVFDGELVVSNNATENTLFTGNNTQAESVDTTGWTNGEKNLEVTGDDSICLTPLTPATDTFTYINSFPPSLSISDPDGTGDTVISSNPYNIAYTLNDPDNTVTAAFYYDTDNTGLNGTAITGACAAAAEGTDVSCQWDTTGIMPGSYYVYGITNDGSGQVSAYSPGQITINGGAGSFVDDFSTNTLGNYTITNTWTEGGTGSVLYDAAGNRLKVLTGNNIGLKFSHNLTSSDRGTFSTDFLPYTKYPSGGELNLRLIQDANNYYGLYHSDGYGPGYIRKVVGGVEVERTSLHAQYSQNSNYRITISFSPGQTTLQAFGETLVLNANASIIIVNKFEVEISQQDAYIDNILYIVNPSDTIAPEVSSTMPADKATGVALNSDVTITFSENIDCTTVTTTTITSSSPGWGLSTCLNAQAVFHTGGQAGLTTYTVTVTTGVRDIAGNPQSADLQFIYTTIDTTAPVVTAFTVPATSTSLDIPITGFTATDNAVVTGYKITTTAAPPLSGDAGWTETTPAVYTAESDGTYTLYPWARDAAGNVSAVFATPRTVIITMRKWTGGGADNLASNPANWLSSIVPQDGDSVLFNGTSAKNCNWNINVPIASLNLNSGYTGVFTLNADMSTTGSLIISDGTFVTDTWNVTVGQ